MYKWLIHVPNTLFKYDKNHINVAIGYKTHFSIYIWTKALISVLLQRTEQKAFIQSEIL